MQIIVIKMKEMFYFGNILTTVCLLIDDKIICTLYYAACLVHSCTLLMSVEFYSLKSFKLVLEKIHADVHLMIS